MCVKAASGANASRQRELLERERFRHEYELLEVLGSGTTSCVQRAIRRADGRHVALKTMRSDDPEMLTFADKEFELLKKLQHPHIIRAWDFKLFSGSATLVLDYFAGSELLATVQRQPEHHLPEVVAKTLSIALVQAVDYLHQHRIVHRDIKPQNILVSNSLDDLRLADFNTAHCLRESTPLTPTGTENYVAPEVILGLSPSESSDVWSLGLCIYFMLSGLLPQRREHFVPNRSVLEQMAKRPITFDDPQWCHVSEPCKTMLSRCLAMKLSERPAPMTMLEDEWLQPAYVPDSARHRRYSSELPYSSEAESLGSVPEDARPTISEAWAEQRGQAANLEDAIDTFGDCDSGTDLSTIDEEDESSSRYKWSRMSSAGFPANGLSPRTESEEDGSPTRGRHAALLEPSSPVEVLDSSRDGSGGTALATILTVHHASATYKVEFAATKKILRVKADRVLPLSAEAAKEWTEALRREEYNRRRARRAERKNSGHRRADRTGYSSW